MSDTPTNTPTSPETDGGDERSGTRKRALRVLGSRMLSREALEKRLRELGETKTSAAEAADWLAGMGLIDDRELARE
ncbi:MAG: hypothetical protein LBC28_00520, partial [Oscillospiraceae bacterium]|nr:hypothetical protein [Oscillospiraceae bacterium]